MTGTLLDLAIIAATGFVSVFSMGFNSRNINNGNYGLAISMSMFIGLSQVYLWKTITDPTIGLAGALTYSVSGGLGVVSAMYIHERFVKSNGSTSTRPFVGE